jgi:hypothetical protein
MRGNITGLLAAAFMAVCGVASANIIYNIDVSDGGETVAGTITTDGFIGGLTAADFVAWNLSATGTSPLSIASPGTFVNCAPSGCGVTAEIDGALHFLGSGNELLSFANTGASISFSGTGVHVSLACGTGVGQPLGATVLSRKRPHTF